MSFTATYIVERLNWRRNQIIRWDEQRLAAYGDYSQAVKDLVAIASRVAAGRGFEPGLEPLAPTEDNLGLLAQAEARRTRASETLRLLTDVESMTAAREMTRCALQLDWLARGKLEGDRAQWRRAYAEYEEARDLYITCARRSLQIYGTHIPDTPRLRSRERIVDPAEAQPMKPEQPQS